MSKIKFNPRKKGYWESQTVGIESKSGHIYSAIDNPSIVVAQGDNRPLAVDIVDCGDFLSLKLYGLNQRVDKITDYKKDLESIKKLHLMPVGVAEYSYDPEYCRSKLTEEGYYAYGLINYNCYDGYVTPGVNVHSKVVDEMQLRIYKDYKVVLIQKIVTPEGKEIYFINKGHHYDETVIVGVKASGKEIKEQLNNQMKTIKIIQNEEEIYPLASFLTKKDRNKLFRYFFPINTRQITKGFLTAAGSYSYDQFCENTQKMINNFFNYDEGTDPRLAIRKKIYFKQECSFSKGIASLSSLLTWVSISDSSLQRNGSLQERIVQILQNAGLDSILNNFEPKINEKVAYWARTEDDIICLVPSNLSSILIYNVKTKKRTFAQYRKEDKTWSFPIPSLDLITSNMNLDCQRGVYDRKKREYPYIFPRTVILGDLTVKELFKGSNIEWILDNVSDEDCKVFNYQLPYYLQGEEGSYKALLNKDVRKKMIIPITEYFQENKIGTFALIVLISTGNIMLEQLLKAKLFNLYFATIESQAMECHSSDLYDYYCMSFFDLDSKNHKGVTFKELMECNSYNINYCRYDDFIIHSKRKNLKEIFNLPLNFLRIINERMVIICEGRAVSTIWWKSNKSKNSKGKTTVYKWHRVHYTCNIIPYIFPEIKNIDPKNIERIADLCMEKTNEGHYYNYRRNSSDVFYGGVSLYLAFGEDLSKINLQQRLNFIEKSSHYDQQKFKDYLKMRKQLKGIQESRPEDIGIFSEKDFPILPVATTRFIRYFEGAQLGWGRASSEQGFLEYYQGKYYEGRDLNSPIKIITSPVTEELIGISLEFNGEGCLKYLHDEAAFWIDVYQNEARNEQFTEAVKRVQPLEWKDPKSNLCIIAPKNIGEIKEEGSVLEHCVSSYIDPIINGTENIMLIRRMDMPEHPFYTLEILNNGEIRQVHCYRNGNLTPEGQDEAYNCSQYKVYNKHFDICSFLQKWAAAFPGKVKVASIKSQYGALIAQWR